MNGLDDRFQTAVIWPVRDIAATALESSVVCHRFVRFLSSDDGGKEIPFLQKNNA